MTWPCFNYALGITFILWPTVIWYSVLQWNSFMRGFSVEWSNIKFEDNKKFKILSLTGTLSWFVFQMNTIYSLQMIHSYIMIDNLLSVGFIGVGKALLDLVSPIILHYRVTWCALSTASVSFPVTVQWDLLCPWSL